MFNSSQLTLARKRRGLTKRRLAQLVDVTDRAVTAWEKGESDPGPQHLLRLERALRFPQAFFLAGDTEEIPRESASFRALSKMTASQRDSALAGGALAIALDEWIGKRFRLPEMTVHRLPLGIDPETAAQVVREEWGLGEQPIPNMIHLLESHGVRIYSLAEQSREVDAFSCWHRETPFIFLNTIKSAEHSRQDAAHELGHLVLHWHHAVPRGPVPEREAQAFASALLMPQATMRSTAPTLLSLKTIISMKRRWRVSATSLVYRLHALGLISDWHYRSAIIDLSKRGYRRRELHGFPQESSQVLNKVLSALRRENIGQAEVAKALNMYPEDIDALVFGLATIAPSGAHGATVEIPRMQSNPVPLRLVTGTND